MRRYCASFARAGKTVVPVVGICAKVVPPAVQRDRCRTRGDSRLTAPRWRRRRRPCARPRSQRDPAGVPVLRHGYPRRRGPTGSSRWPRPAHRRARARECAGRQDPARRARRPRARSKANATALLPAGWRGAANRPPTAQRTPMPPNRACAPGRSLQARGGGPPPRTAAASVTRVPPPSRDPPARGRSRRARRRAICPGRRALRAPGSPPTRSRHSPAASRAARPPRHTDTSGDYPWIAAASGNRISTPTLAGCSRRR